MQRQISKEDVKELVDNCPPKQVGKYKRQLGTFVRRQKRKTITRIKDKIKEGTARPTAQDEISFLESYSEDAMLQQVWGKHVMREAPPPLNIELSEGLAITAERAKELITSITHAELVREASYGVVKQLKQLRKTLDWKQHQEEKKRKAKKERVSKYEESKQKKNSDKMEDKKETKEQKKESAEKKSDKNESSKKKKKTDSKGLDVEDSESATTKEMRSASENKREAESNESQFSENESGSDSESESENEEDSESEEDSSDESEHSQSEDETNKAVNHKSKGKEDEKESNSSGKISRRNRLSPEEYEKEKEEKKIKKAYEKIEIGKFIRAVVTRIEKYGVLLSFFQNGIMIRALCMKKECIPLSVQEAPKFNLRDFDLLEYKYKEGDRVTAVVTEVDSENRRVGASFLNEKFQKDMHHHISIESLVNGGTDASSQFIGSLSSTPTENKKEIMRRSFGLLKRLSSTTTKTDGKNRLGQRERKRLQAEFIAQDFDDEQGRQRRQKERKIKMLMKRGMTREVAEASYAGEERLKKELKMFGMEKEELRRGDTTFEERQHARVLESEMKQRLKAESRDEIKEPVFDIGHMKRKTMEQQSQDLEGLHPSWVAKLKAEKQVSFQGKKVKFD